MTTLKFGTVLILHVLLFIGFFLLADYLPFVGFTAKDAIFALVFSALYFFLVWFDLYSRPYHHYLKNAFFYIFRDLFICSLCLFALEYVYSLVNHVRYFRGILLNDGLLVVFYFSMHVIQYLWIIHLANLGFFRKNVMLVGTYDERIPVEHLF